MGDPLLDDLPGDPLLADLPSDPLLADLPPAREPTAQEMGRGDLFQYQPPSQGVLAPQPPPAMQGPAPMPAPQPLLQAQPPRPTPQQALQAAGDATVPGPMEFGGGFVKGAAGSLSAGAYKPNISRSEQAGSEMGAIAGGMVPLALSATPAAALTVPAMFAQQGLPATAGQVNPSTGQLADPVQAAIQMGFLAAVTALPPAVGQSLAARGLTGAGLGELQSIATQAVQAAADGGELDLTNPAAVKDQITNVLMGAAFGMGARPRPAPRPDQGAYQGPAADQGMIGPFRGNEAPRSMNENNTAAFAERVSRETFEPDPLLADLPPAAPEAPAEPGQAKQVAADALRETRLGLPPDPTYQGHLFGRADAPPEDIQAARFVHGAEARFQEAMAEGNYEAARQAHAEAIRGSVEADNAYGTAFPDEVPNLPAARDEARRLQAAIGDRARGLEEAEAGLGTARAARESAQRQAGFYAGDNLPRFTPEQARGRKLAMDALRETGRSPEEIRDQLAISDRNPEFYGDVETRAATMTPEVRERLFGKAEAPALKQEAPLEGGDGAHQLSFELEFGQASPMARKFPEFASLSYEKKAEVTQKVLERVTKIAKHLVGVKEGVSFYGPGGWGDNPLNPSGQLRGDMTPEKARDLARVVGFLAQQDAVYVSRAHPGGKNIGIDIRHESFFGEPKNVEAFWDALRKEDPELASGFYPIRDGNLTGIRIGRPESAAEVAALEQRFGPLIDKVSKQFGLETRTKFRKLDGEEVSSKWKEAPDGGEYIRGLGGRLGPDIQERLERVYRPTIEGLVRENLPRGKAGRALFQEDAAGAAPDGRAVGAGDSGLRRRFGIDPEAIAKKAPEGVKSIYKALGNKTADHDTTPDLKIYPLGSIQDAPAKLDAWLKKDGWSYKIFGPDQESGKFVPPNFKEFSYDNKHVWIFSPWTKDGSFKDTEYTRTWRVTHEVAHGQTNEQLTAKYGGVGRRQGALGRATVFNGREIPPLGLADAMRAVEWEHDTFRRQREILESEFGIKITDEQFRKENSTNMSDALYRVLSGDFSNPGELGLVPRAVPPDQILARAKDILRQAAKDMDLDLAETFGGKRVEVAKDYQRAGAEVDGRTVGEEVANQDSIEASLTDYEILPGIREVPMSEFPNPSARDMYAGRSSELKRVDQLAEAIKASGRIDPLIVVLDKDGAYVLEGGHRLAALHKLGAKSLPAMVVKDLEGLAPEASRQEDGDNVKGAFIPSEPAHKAALLLFRGKSDVSTYLHEHGHWLLENALAGRGKARDLSAVETWIKGELGESAIKGKEWTTDAKEMFARGFERFLRDGETAIAELRPIFQRLKDYLSRIYQDVMAGPLRREVPAEVKKVFDAMLGAEIKKAPEVSQGGPKRSAEARRPMPERERSATPGGSLASESTPGTRPASSRKEPEERSLPLTLEENNLPGGTDRTYTPKSNVQTQARAEQTILRKGLDKAAADILAKDKPSAEQTATALNIMKQWQAEADKLPDGEEKLALTEKTVGLASEMARRLTNLGQAIQAVRILERLSPDAVVLFAQRRVQKANDAARKGQPNIVLKPEQAEGLREAAKALESARGFEEDVGKLADVAARPRAKLTEADLGALKAFRDRMRAYLGETPPAPPKGAMGPGRARKPAPAPKPKDDLEAYLDAQEAAALERLGARGRKPAKALLQTATETQLSADEIEDFATVFASRLGRRGDRSVGAIKRNFRESFGDDLSPHLDQIAQRGAKILSQARSRRARLAAIGTKVNQILSPLDEDAGTVHQAEALRASLDEMQRLTGHAKVEAGQRLQLALQALQHPSLWKDVAAAQTVAQLLNPKTQIRNASNVAFALIEDLRNFLDTPIDMVRSQVTGGPRRITFRTPETSTFPEWLAGMPRRAKEFADNAKRGAVAGWEGVSPTGVDSPFDLSAQTFMGRGPVQRSLRFLRKSLGAVMTSLDYPFYERAMGNRMGQIAWLKVINEKVPEAQRKQAAMKYLREMRAGFDSMADHIEEAKNYGLYMTFQDPNVVSQALGKFKRGANRLTGTPEFGLGDFVMKYPRIPGGLFMRALEYSPMGLARSAFILAKPHFDRGAKPDPAEAQRALSRAIVGVGGLSGLGFILAQAGVLTGRSEEDADAKAFMKEQLGVTQYQVNASALKRFVTSGFDVKSLKKEEGDELWSYDWVQPIAVSMSIGANAWKRLENEEAPWAGAMGTALESVMGGINTLFEQPVLANIVELFRTHKQGENPLEKLPKILEGVPASFVPTILNQVRQVKDNTARDTFSPSIAQRTLNKALYKLPFLSETLPAAYKTLGKDFPKEVYQDGSNSLFNVFFNPSFVSKHKVDSLLEAIMQPYETEGRVKQFPKRAPRKLAYTNRDGKQTLELDGHEVSALQRAMAQNTLKAMQGIDFDKLKAKSAEHQEEELADRVNDAWNRSRAEFLKDKGIKFNH